MRTKRTINRSSLSATSHTIINFAMLTISEVREAFELWISDGNAVETNGYWSTQDAQWRNKIESKRELFIYFIKEYYYEFI